MAPYLGMRGIKLTAAINVCSCLCFFLFGYDQGDLASLLTVPAFRRQFPQIDTYGQPGNNHVAVIQGITVASWNIGCIASAIITIWLGGMIGRRKTIFIGLAFLVIGEIVQCTSFSLGQLIAGRVIAGFGNGFNTATVPAWQSEVSRGHKRGTYLMLSGAAIALGVATCYWLAFGFAYLDPSSASWRVPIAIQLVVAFIAGGLLIYLPESPRWLILTGRKDEALQVLTALDNLPPDHPHVYAEFLAIKDAVVEQINSDSESVTSSHVEGRFTHRMILSFGMSIFQQISGVNLFTQFLALILLQQTGYEGWVARLIAAGVGTSSFVFSFVPIVGIDNFWGRRSLMIFGATGMCISMVVITIMRSRPSSGTNIATTVFIFIFNIFFVIGWQGMAWLYAAEIVPLRVRGVATALSTSINWLFNFAVVLITPIAFAHIGYRTYIIFAACNAFIVPCVYLFYPETAFRTLEEIDWVFHSSSRDKRPWFSVVQRSLDAPLWYGRNGEKTFSYENSEWHVAHLSDQTQSNSNSNGERGTSGSDDAALEKGELDGSPHELSSEDTSPQTMGGGSGSERSYNDATAGASRGARMMRPGFRTYVSTSGSGSGSGGAEARPSGRAG